MKTEQKKIVRLGKRVNGGGKGNRGVSAPGPVGGGGGQLETMEGRKPPKSKEKKQDSHKEGNGRKVYGRKGGGWVSRAINPVKGKESASQEKNEKKIIEIRGRDRNVPLRWVSRKPFISEVGGIGSIKKGKESPRDKEGE